MKRLRVACSCSLAEMGAPACSRRTHHVSVYVRRGPLCVGKGRDSAHLWYVYHVPTGCAYPRDFTSKTAAKKAMLTLLKIAGETWWSQTDPKAMAADEKIVERCSKAVPRKWCRV